jgi:Prion-inhibition and propagation
MPIDPVGVALAAAGLLPAILEAFHIIEQCRSSGKNFQILFYRLEFEKLKLSLWGEESKLSLLSKHGIAIIPEPLCRPIVLDMVLRCLSVIGILLLDAGPLTKRYTPKVAATPDPQQTPPVLPQIEQFLVVISNHVNKEQNIMDALDEVCGQMKRDMQEHQRRKNPFKLFRWAISDRDKFESLVANVHAFVDNLYSLLPRQQAVQLDRSFLNDILAGKPAQALKEVEEAGADVSGSYAGLAAAATLKELQNSNHSILVGRFSVSDLKVPVSSLGYLPAGNARWFPRKVLPPLPSKPEERIFVEWKQYDRGLSDEVVERIQENAFDLTLCLRFVRTNRQTATLNCLGFFNDIRAEPSPRIGFVYEYPPDVDISAKPITLSEMLTQRPPPSTDKRLALSQKLSETVYHLLISNWLHKSLRSMNILFFRKKIDSSESTQDSLSVDISLPYITAFDYSRPDNQYGVSLKPGLSIEFDRYKHPDYSTPSSRSTIDYHKLHDIFSLGVILLEIGLWQSVASLYSELEKLNARKNREPISPPLQDFQKLYSPKYAQELGYRVGPKFQRAVMRCLNGDFLVQDVDPDDRILLNQFNKLVVTEISQCVI